MEKCDKGMVSGVPTFERLALLLLQQTLSKKPVTEYKLLAVGREANNSVFAIILAMVTFALVKGREAISCRFWKIRVAGKPITPEAKQIIHDPISIYEFYFAVPIKQRCLQGQFFNQLRRKLSRV